tara:strand:- start:222 stop:386 length:165 start_codon:yes stop_codon:yes gene_type:complete
MITIETSTNKDIIFETDSIEANMQLVRFAISVLQSLDNRKRTFTIMRDGQEEQL